MWERGSNSETVALWTGTEFKVWWEGVGVGQQSAKDNGNHKVQNLQVNREIYSLTCEFF